MEQKRHFAHECRKTWVQANFQHIDPNFYKRWKAKENIMCLDCKKELLTEEDDDLETTISDEILDIYT
jgi:hypothetical protein